MTEVHERAVLKVPQFPRGEEKRKSSALLEFTVLAVIFKFRVIYSGLWKRLPTTWTVADQVKGIHKNYQHGAFRIKQAKHAIGYGTETTLKGVFVFRSVSRLFAGWLWRSMKYTHRPSTLDKWAPHRREWSKASGAGDVAILRSVAWLLCP